MVMSYETIHLWRSTLENLVTTLLTTLLARLASLIFMATPFRSYTSQSSLNIWLISPTHTPEEGQIETLVS